MGVECRTCGLVYAASRQVCPHCCPDKGRPNHAYQLGQSGPFDHANIIHVLCRRVDALEAQVRASEGRFDAVMAELRAVRAEQDLARVARTS